ncbi:MAG: diguanylate cyclase, partial [Chloroflexota bacterium]
MLQRTIDILRTDLDQLADDWVRAMNASLPPESRKAVPVGELVERARTVIDGAILGLAGEDSTEFRVGGEAFAAAVKLGQLGKDCGYELDHVIRPFALLRQRVLELLGGNLRQGDAGPLCTAARLDSSLDQLLLWTADAFLNARIQELQRQAITDGLTGTFTHDHFLRRLEEEMERSRRYGQPVTLLMADLDTLKVINDRFGHLSGDEVLRQVADLLVNTCRRVDVVARYGGDEFGIILPQTDSEGAKKLAKRIVQGVASNVHLSKQEDFVTTISVGLAAYPQDADTPRALTEAADRAMYRAKAAGGNMVCWDDGALAPSDSSAQGEHSRSLTMQFRGVLRELVDRLERENREMEESLAEVQHRLDAHERHEAAIQDTVAEMIAGVIPPARRDKKPSQEGEAENEPSAVLLAVAERTNDLCRTVEGWTEDSLSAVPGIGAAV